MVLMWWFDDDRKKTVSEKIAEALAAYERKFKAPANVVLVNAAELGEAQGAVRVRAEPYIQRSNFYVGVDDPA